MTNVMDAFEHLNSLSQSQLFERRTALVGQAPNGDYRALSDEALQELVAISRVLRRKTSSTPKPPASRKGNAIPSLDAI
jgi:cytochrome c553